MTYRAWGSVVFVLALLTACDGGSTGEFSTSIDVDGGEPSAEGALSSEVTLLSFSSAWRYLDAATAPSGWQATAFADSAWKSGAGEFGFGDGDEATKINQGSPKRTAFYFRTSFNVTKATDYAALRLRFVRDDGAVLYLNGTEFARSNMPSGTITATTLASAGVWDRADETKIFEAAVPTNLLRAGTNVLAVEVHQNDAYSSDVSWKAELLGTPAGATPPPPTAPTAWTCPTFNTGVKSGNIANGAIVEASGIAASWRNAGVYYTHNDSGDSARFFATTLQGKDLATFNVSGASASDWEDIAVGPGPAAGTSYVYIGDIGGNGGRNALSIYRVAEPTVSATQSPITQTISGATRFNVVYPNGEKYDAETMFVDPTNADIYIVTKTTTGASRVFRDPAPQNASVTTTLQQVASYNFPTSADPKADGGDMSPNGSEIIVRTYNRVYLWHREAGASVAAAFTKTACEYKIITEQQGEAAAFAQNGKDLVLTTEGSKPPIYTYARK